MVACPTNTVPQLSSAQLRALTSGFDHPQGFHMMHRWNPIALLSQILDLCSDARSLGQPVKSDRIGPLSSPHLRAECVQHKFARCGFRFDGQAVRRPAGARQTSVWFLLDGCDAPSALSLITHKSPISRRLGEGGHYDHHSTSCVGKQTVFNHSGQALLLFKSHCGC